MSSFSDTSSEYYEYEFNPYDSDSYPDPFTSFIDEEDRHSHSQHSISTSPSNINIPEADIPDPSIAICYSLDQSKQLIQKRFGVSPSTFRSKPIPGIVVLPLKDINLIRKDNRYNRILPHIIVFPTGENFNLVHQDFAQSIQILNK